jgi:hypothetical protein
MPSGPQIGDHLNADVAAVSSEQYFHEFPLCGPNKMFDQMTSLDA